MPARTWRRTRRQRSDVLTVGWPTMPHATWSALQRSMIRPPARAAAPAFMGPWVCCGDDYGVCYHRSQLEGLALTVCTTGCCRKAHQMGIMSFIKGGVAELAIARPDSAK